MKSKKGQQPGPDIDPSITASLPLYMNEKQLAEFLGINPQTLSVWRCTKRGGPPYIKVGRAVRYSRAHVAAWIAERTVTMDPPPNNKQSPRVT